MHSTAGRRAWGGPPRAHRGIYGHFTCGVCAQTVHWLSCAAAVFLPLGLDGGVNPPPYAHRAPAKGSFFCFPPHPEEHRAAMRLEGWGGHADVGFTRYRPYYMRKSAIAD